MHLRLPSRRATAGSALAAVLIATLPGCTDAPETAPPAEVARPAKIVEIGAGAADTALRFPGRVRATRRAELAFGTAGRLVELPVREGQRVAAGALIARLEPANFRARLAAAEAEYDKARLDYDRVNRVWEQSRAVARAEVDQKRTALQVARSTRDAARKDLEDARLVAPFDGVVVQRFVENFRNVQPNEPIVSLQDPRQLEIVIHVPERVVRAERRREVGFATFDDLPGRRFTVRLKSFAGEADPQTQSYEAVLTFDRPEGVTILPGMSATVFPDASGTDPATGDLLVPLAAIAAGPGGEPRVWVVDPKTSRVQQRNVATGPVRSDLVVVTKGLAAGERIVAAGASGLRDGMLVRPL
jgi:RND family efflux transporter MFP subunit